jgi:hypothetical protein
MVSLSDVALVVSIANGFIAFVSSVGRLKGRRRDSR